METGFYTYLVLLLLISVVGFMRYKKLSDGFKVLTILIVCTLVSESIKRVIGKIYHNSMPVGHLWAVLEYCFFSFTYYYLLNNALIKKIIIASLFGMVLLEIVNIIFFESLLQFPSIILNVSQFIYVFYSFLLFRQMLLSPAEQSLFKQSLFWFNLDVLFYGTTMFLNFALTSYFIQNKLDAMALFRFSVVVNFIFYIGIGISIWLDNKATIVTGLADG